MSMGPLGWHDEDEGLPEPARVVRPLPATLLWRWRNEGAALTAVALVWWSCAVVAGPLVAFTVMTGLLAVLSGVRPVRRWIVGWTWGVMTPHRIRLACAEAGVVSPRGKLPAVVFTRRTPYGERVYLWCPPGLDPVDVAAARPAIAALCWASQVTVLATPQFPAVAVLEVVRELREPLSPTRSAPHRSAPALRRRLGRHTRRPSPAPGGIVW
jgi:hypothetical protein